MSFDSSRGERRLLIWLWVITASTAALTLGLLTFYMFEGDLAFAVRVLLLFGVSGVSCLVLITAPKAIRSLVNR